MTESLSESKVSHPQVFLKINNLVRRMVDVFMDWSETWYKQADMLIFTDIKYKLSERFGGFLFHPAKTMKTLLKKSESTNSNKNNEEDIIIMMIFTRLLSIFTGVFLCFFFVYPELYAYQDAIHEEIGVWLVGMSQWYILLAIFCVGYYIMSRFLTENISKWSYYIFNRLNKQNLHLKTTDAVNDRIRNFKTIYAFRNAPSALFLIFGAFFIYFVERMNYAKIFFPFIDLYMTNMIFFGFLLITMVWRYLIDIKINRAYFNVSIGYAIIPSLIEISIWVLISILTAIIANNMVLMFA